MADIQPFWYLQYLPSWMPITIFNLIMWYFFIFIFLDWKNYKPLKFKDLITWKVKNSKNNIITEDDIVYSVVFLFYGFLFFFCYFDFLHYFILFLFFCFNSFCFSLDILIDAITPLGYLKALKNGAYEICLHLINKLYLIKDWFLSKINK